MPSLPCRRCDQIEALPTDPDSLCYRCVATEHGIDLTDDQHPYAIWEHGNEGYSADYIGFGIDSHSDDQPLLIVNERQSIEVHLARAYRAGLPFHIETSWSPERGLRHAIQFHPDVQPTVWNQLPQAQLPLKFLNGFMPSNVGRSRLEDDPLAHERARRARDRKRKFPRLGRPDIAEDMGLSESQLYEILRRIPEA